MNISKTKWYDLFLFTGAYRYLLALSLGLIISSILGALVPKMVTSLASSYDKDELFYYSIYSLGVVFILVYFNNAFYEYIGNSYVTKLIINARSKCYASWILSYDIKNGSKSNKELYPQGEVLARIISDTEVLRELVTSGTLGIFIDVFFVISCLISFFLLNTVTGTILIIAEVLSVILLLRGSRYMRVVFNRVRHARGEVSRTLANVISGVSEIYYTRNDKYASKKSKVTFDLFLQTQLSSNFWDASYFAIAESLYPLLLALVVFIFPYSHITETAIIFALVDLIQRSIDPIKRVSGKVANIQRAMTGITRISEFVFDLESSVSTPYGRISDRNLNFKELYVSIPKFSYELEGREGRFLLKDIEFTARKGDLIGIVGLSGCGKSTLLNIIAGNIMPSVGGVTLLTEKSEKYFFPGNNIEDIVKYRDKVGIVSQESHIFSETVFFNISMNLVSLDEFNIFWDWICDKISYIKKWGIGPNDRINPDELSLGQKQLLSAIRACLLKKPVILFDEISSALDSDLEFALREVVRLIQQHSLTIVVTHRIETIFGADCIYVMSNGAIIDHGGHEYLVKNSKGYQEFIRKMSDSIWA